MNYYGNLKAEPRVIIKAEVVNPAKFTMEIGDICTFSSMLPTKAFNKSYSGRYFMITELVRSSGKLSATFLDVTKIS